jgi:hypothetical protein
MGSESDEASLCGLVAMLSAVSALNRQIAVRLPLSPPH